MKPIIAAQYRAALAMFGDAVAKCDDALWLDTGYKHPFWRVAYHTVFFTDLYLSESVEGFVPWDKHVDELESLGPMPHKDGKLPIEGPPYAKADVTEYWQRTYDRVEEAVEATDLDAASGFFWLPFTKLELQFYNIRHVQHHAGQLIERVRQKLDQPVGWIGSR